MLLLSGALAPWNGNAPTKIREGAAGLKKYWIYVQARWGGQNPTRWLVYLLTLATAVGLDEWSGSRVDWWVPDLRLHGRSIETVFELMGISENAITFSLGWALRESPSLATLLMKDVLPSTPVRLVNGIRLQEYSAQQGITDIEIEAGDVRVIVEAKRGWTLPTRGQLQQYAARKPHLIVVLSECSEAYATPRLDKDVGGVPVTHRSWRDVAKLTRAARRTGNRSEGRVLDEFLTYLETAMPVQDQESNLVYVVSLSLDTPKGWGISNIEIVEKMGRYFHPVGNRWPTEPPTYLGFRYHGKLQSIRHVDGYEVGTNPHSFLKEIPSDEWDPHFFYTLGPPIVPPHEVRTGNIFRNHRVRAALDLLLTSKTIEKARDETGKRLERWAK